MSLRFLKEDSGVGQYIMRRVKIFCNFLTRGSKYYTGQNIIWHRAFWGPVVYEINIVVSQQLDIVTGDVRSGVLLLKHRNNAVIL